MILASVKKDIVTRISSALKNALNVELAESDISNLVQDGGVEGVDIECRIAFRVAKQAGLSPVQVAEKLLPHLLGSAHFTVTNLNGYLNFRLADKFYSDYVSAQPKPSAKGMKVIVEFPSVNPNKPLHIGHLRNAVIGDSLSSMLSLSGHTVVRMNYIDDLGLQVAQSLYSYWDAQNGASVEKFDHMLGKQYVEVAAQMEADPALKEKVENIMKQLEHGAGDVCRVGREMCRKCVDAQAKTLESLNITQDVQVWESDVVRAGLLASGVALLEKKGILVTETEGKNAGCKVVRLSAHPEFKGMEDADKVFVRGNGVATYTAKDIAFQMWKLGLLENPVKFCGSKYVQSNGKEIATSCQDGTESTDYNGAEKVVNVIGVEQEYPQKVIRVALEMAGFAGVKNRYVHVSYGHARLKDARFSGRKGTWVGFSADDLVTESVSRATALVSDKFRDYCEAEKVEIARKVGISAIRFSFIRISPEKELVFDWDKALTFEGDSGPYLQYSYARAVHILEKEPADADWKGPLTYAEPAEKKLILTMARFDGALDKAVEQMAPHRMADYALTLSSDFNSFYASCRVVGENKDVSESRKRLVERYLLTLEKCLKILGIPVIRNM